MKKLVADKSHPAFISAKVRDYRYFFLNLSPAPQSELTVACGGWEACAPDYCVDRDNLGFHGIEYVAKGRGCLLMNNEKHELIPGSVFAYDPLTKHKISSSSEDPLVKYFIDFSGRNARQITGRKVFGAECVLYLNHAQPIHDLNDQMLDTGLKGGKLAPRLCALILEMLALRIEETGHTPADYHGGARQRFEEARSKLHEHFRTTGSVCELARLVHLNASYLSRLFHRFSGEGPHEMLMRRKVNEAAAELLGTNQSIKEVAASVGFLDPYHFSRVFKKYHGISPANFRLARAHVTSRKRASRAMLG